MRIVVTVSIAFLQRKCHLKQWRLLQFTLGANCSGGGVGASTQEGGGEEDKDGGGVVAVDNHRYCLIIIY